MSTPEPHNPPLGTTLSKERVGEGGGPYCAEHELVADGRWGFSMWRVIETATGRHITATQMTGEAACEMAERLNIEAGRA